MKKIFYLLTIYVIIVSVNKNYAREYNNSPVEAVDNSNINCWVGWKNYHFGATTPLTKKNEPITFTGWMLDSNTGEWSTYQNEVTTNGYGYYSLIFNKQVVGMLAYIKSKIGSGIGNYWTNYIPTLNSTVIDYSNDVNEEGRVNLRVAIDIAIAGMVGSNYNANYENVEFRRFWEGTFIAAYEGQLKKLQNEFYWKAYGMNAFTKLTQMMDTYGNGYYNHLSNQEKEVLKGVVLSIMEARYRHKNVQNKMNLQIKVAEGDLLPFLVSLENLKNITRSGSSAPYTYIDTETHNTHYKFPLFDTLIDSVYQYMYYYDREVISDTTHSTVMQVLATNADGELETGEEIDADWGSEYWALTGSALPTLSGEGLEDFYNKCYLARSAFKKSSENTEGIFGSEEIYDITSDINFSEALSNMQQAMIIFAGEVGGNVGEIFSGLDSAHIARSYVMAKNIVETNRVQDEYAYYDIGTNIITYTPRIYGNEYMLVDFQKVKLKRPLKVNLEGSDPIDTYEDTDGDGLYDRYELGSKKKVDITPFIKKMVEKELYGNDTESINSTDGKLMIDNVMAQVKYNIYYNRYSFDEENSDNNRQNWKENYENNMNIDEETRITLNNQSSEIEKQQYLSLVPSKIEVELWRYISNPTLKDTDFDGIEDGLGKAKLQEIERTYGLTEDN